MTMIQKAGYILLYLVRCAQHAFFVLPAVATTFITGAAGMAVVTVCGWLVLSNPDTATFNDFLRFIHSPILMSLMCLGGVTSLVLRYVISRRVCTCA
ncbi:hypothetical protein [Pseudomonas sp. NPDC089569]|uniref:hypothetical protein n=1 Tax=Pseudomonas sp. NPDC089569 TaxID=3390722 RepID=UPI003CFCBA88